MKRKVQLLLPTLPSYRNDFLTKLNSSISDKYELLVVHGNKFNGKAIFHVESKGFKSYECNTIEFSVFNYRISWQKGMIRKFVEERPDALILLFNPGIITFWLIVFISKIRRVPFAIWASGHKRPEIIGIKEKIRKLINNSFLSMAKVHISYGSKYAEYLKKNLHNKSIYVAQNTINIEGIVNAPCQDKEKCREFIGVKDKNSVIILFVGAIIKEKKLAQAIAVMHKLKNENINFYFFIIGKGDEKDTLIQEVNNFAITDRINIRDAIYGEELAKYYFAADLFLLPGTGGLAVNEAMAYGLPVISTPGDGTVSDLLINDKNGYLMNSGDEEQLYTSLKKFLSIDSSTKRRMGEFSKEIIKTKASLGNMVKQFHKAIEDLSN